MATKEEIEVICHKIYEQCARISEALGNAEIAAQIRKAAGNTTVIDKGNTISIEGTWVPSEQKK